MRKIAEFQWHRANEKGVIGKNYFNWVMTSTRIVFDEKMNIQIASNLNYRKVVPRLVSSPSWVGMVPLSWLILNSMSAGVKYKRLEENTVKPCLLSIMSKLNLLSFVRRPNSLGMVPLKLFWSSIIIWRFVKFTIPFKLPEKLFMLMLRTPKNALWK